MHDTNLAMLFCFAVITLGFSGSNIIGCTGTKEQLRRYVKIFCGILTMNVALIGTYLIGGKEAFQFLGSLIAIVVLLAAIGLGSRRGY